MKLFLAAPTVLAALLVAVSPASAGNPTCGTVAAVQVTPAYTPTYAHSAAYQASFLFVPASNYTVGLSYEDSNARQIETLKAQIATLDAKNTAVTAQLRIQSLEAEVARLNANRPAEVPPVTIAATGLALLKAECSRCHTGPAAKGGAIDFDHMADDLRQRSAERIALGEMPPAPVKVDAKKKVALILAASTK